MVVYHVLINISIEKNPTINKFIQFITPKTDELNTELPPKYANNNQNEYWCIGPAINNIVDGNLLPKILLTEARPQ